MIIGSWRACPFDKNQHEYIYEGEVLTHIQQYAHEYFIWNYKDNKREFIDLTSAKKKVEEYFKYSSNYFDEEE